MRGKKTSFDVVRRVGLTLPGVEEGTTYGSPVLKVGGKMFACLAIHRSAEPDTLAIRIDFADRDQLIEADPRTYYLTDHYVDYPVVLVRLSRVDRDTLRDLLGMAWRFVSRRRKRATGPKRNMSTRKRKLILVLFAAAISSVSAQSARDPLDALLDVLVWGTYMPINSEAYAPAVRSQLDVHLRRSASYVSKRPILPPGEGNMVRTAAVNYERRLVAVTDDPDARQLAAAYVDELRPCYEWEGYHDCPEREAEFADRYQATHPGGPFSAFLPLLAAHRWLCAAEGYDYEGQQVAAAQSRAEYRRRLSIALKSTAPLIRTAAERLGVRGTCRS